MRRPDPRPLPGHRRSGQTLILFALLFPVLLGMVGLIIDGGLMMAAFRQTQNVADAAALAASMDRIRGETKFAATATATTFVRDPQFNNMPDATVVINMPPLSGPYAGNGDYTEAILTNRVQTTFIQILGVNRDQRVQARAVAGFEATAIPGAAPGCRSRGAAPCRSRAPSWSTRKGRGWTKRTDGWTWGCNPTPPRSATTPR
jgi:hypothetical protein